MGRIAATCRIALTAFVSCLAAHADVLVVAPSGGNFTGIAQAVEAAHEGDVILVRPAMPDSAYQHFVIDGKSLTISAEHDGDLIVTRIIGVKDLAAGQHVVLRGLTVVPNTSGQPIDKASGIDISQCAGSVRVESCVVTGSAGMLAQESGGAPGIRAGHCADVGIAHCTVAGGAGASSGSNDWFGTDGGHGLLALDSTVVVHDSQLRGGIGGSHFDPDVEAGEFSGVGDGGHGAVTTGTGTLTLAGCTLTGGAGGKQIINLSFSIGGSGVAKGQGSTLVRTRGSNFAGGAGTSKDGRAVLVQADSFLEFDESPRHLETTSPVREHDTLPIDVTGLPADAAFLLVATGPALAWFGGLKGALLVDPLAATLQPLGTLPADGTLHADLPVPGLAAGVEALDLHLQLVVFHDRLTLENGSVVTLLDEAF
jgi:hypothetical protein